MRTPEEVEKYLKEHFFTNIKEAHKFRNHLMTIFIEKFTIKYLWAHKYKQNMNNVITYEDAIKFLNK